MQQCCDHPYLVDQMLQSSLTNSRPVTDILDIGVRSCGKLLLLDKMLQKIRTEGLRVLILSQVRHPWYCITKLLIKYAYDAFVISSYCINKAFDSILFYFISHGSLVVGLATLSVTFWMTLFVRDLVLSHTNVLNVVCYFKRNRQQ